jgi:oligoribonuclease NrnB/cAMP/cGMP phosphodiesterase (DHH superfamily)
MRIVTRPDFDGIVCAVLILEAENISPSVKWVSPDDMQKGNIDIRHGDIIANLPYHPDCSLWFDHHFSNRIRHKIKGLFEIAPSAAGLVFKYYQNKLQKDFTKLVTEADKIDSANLSLNEILTPEKYPYVLLSMTIQDHIPSDEPYWNRVLDLLRNETIETILSDTEVRERSKAVIRENVSYQALLKKYTRIVERVAISDFRDLDRMPYGNRFLVYSMFPEAVVSVKIGFEDPRKEKVAVKIGHSILNKDCRVNVGQMLSYFGGGGHKGVGACRFPVEKIDEYLPNIIDILRKNEPEGSIVVKITRRDQDRRDSHDRRKASQENIAQGRTSERRENERRNNPEQRKDWKKTNTWQSIKIIL